MPTESIYEITVCVFDKMFFLLFQSSEPILRPQSSIDKVEFLNLKQKLQDLQSKHEIFAQLINQKVPTVPKEKKFLSQ